MTMTAWMDAALAEARAALEHGDVPVGAVVVDLEAGADRRRRATTSASASATRPRTPELLALRDAARASGSWRLDGHALVVTLEPCPMCAGAVWAARVPLSGVRCGRPEGGRARAASTTSPPTLG